LGFIGSQCGERKLIPLIKTEQKCLRFSPETVQQIEALSRLWGTISRPPAAAVVAECVRRVHQLEFEAKPERARNRKGGS
jgi:hypothetical protein